MLDDGSISHGKSGAKETRGDSCDWPEWDADFSEERVYEAIEDWDEEDDDDRVLCFVSDYETGAFFISDGRRSDW